METTITLTESAQTYLKTQLKKNNSVAFRLSIKKTGCSGFAYAPEMVQTIDAKDERIEVEGITILIDVKWLHLLNGLTIDYIEENKTGLKQKRLVFINPNEASRCGCGESFHAP